MLVIDSEQDYNQFIDSLNKDSKIVVVPIYNNDFMHGKLRSLCLVWIYEIQTKNGWILTMDHSESLYNLSAALLFKALKDKDIKLKFFLDKKEFIYDFPEYTNCIDIELFNFIDSGNKLVFPNFDTQTFFKRMYPKYRNINSLVPLTKWIEYFEVMKPIILNIVYSYSSSDRAFNFYNNIVVPSISKIESNGIAVDLTKINKSVDKMVSIDEDKSLIYTQYNIFTTTGRPSNRFNNINFAALNKEDGSRDFIISRFDKGSLLEFDFESYHLRIIGNLINYKLPLNESMHEYLGKKYFNKEEDEPLTEDEYNESKKISFRQLYGGVLKEYAHIEYFTNVDKYIKDLWLRWNVHGYIESPVSGRRLYKKNYPKLSSQKLFNYFIQLLETELTLQKVERINKVLESYETKLIMYTYDALLFDFKIEDGKKCIEEIQEILDSKDVVFNNSSQYITRKYIGNNYGNMREILFN